MHQPTRTARRRPHLHHRRLCSAGVRLVQVALGRGRNIRIAKASSTLRAQRLDPLPLVTCGLTSPNRFAHQRTASTI